MTDTSAMTTDQIEDFAFRALVAAGTAEANARAVARSSAAAERDGIASHGLAYIPIYAEHVQCGKVDGQAVPVVATPAASMITVDAATGFAHPAIDAGFEKLIPLARTNGIAALAINNSYNCGVLGYHTERLAEAGLVGIGFTNAPASIAPSGGSKPVVGTNPFSIAVPDGQGGAAIAIDQSASVIAKSEVSKHAREGKPIPEGWALDPDGNPTTDPAIGLKGSMVPSGGYKGVSIALMTEIMAAALAGATLGSQASPFAGTAGGPPRTGQFFMAIEPGLSSGGLFAERITDLVASMATQDGVHIPGAGRHSARARNAGKPIAINPATIAKIEAIIAG